MTYLQRYFYKVPENQHDPAAIAFYAGLDAVAKVAPSVTVNILNELKDETSHLKLIASENFSSLACQLAMGNLLTDKYAEGISFKRFYAGCDNVDAVEAEAEQELKQLFGAEYAYVQPHSGCDANLVAYWAILTKRIQDPYLEEKGKKLDELTDEEFQELREMMNNAKMLGMSLNSGGHLTHGYRHNASSRMMRCSSYNVGENGWLDYNELNEQVQREKPDILLAGYSAYPRKLNFEYFRQIADGVGATLMVDMAHFAGLVAGKVFVDEFDPVAYADVVTSTTHKTLRGPRGGIILAKKEYSEAIKRGCPMVLGGPLPHVMAAKCVAFKEASRPDFIQYAHQVVANAQAMAEALGEGVLTGGTDNHMVLLDVRQFGINGRQAEKALREAHLTVNRNAIPDDPNGPWYTSGIRVGTPAMTTLGMGEEQAQEVAQLIRKVLEGATGEGKAKVSVDSKVLNEVRAAVRALLDAHPLYPELDIEHPEHVGA